MQSFTRTDISVAAEGIVCAVFHCLCTFCNASLICDNIALSIFQVTADQLEDEQLRGSATLGTGRNH